MMPAALVAGPIEFEMAGWLWLLPPAIAAVLLLARRSLTLGSGGTRRAALLVRLVFVTIVVCALAEPNWRDESQQLAVTAVIDVSRSVPTGMQSGAMEYLSEAAAVSRTQNDLLGGVSAARTPYVQSLPSRQRTSIEPENIGSIEGSNLEEALRMALAIRPGDAAYRLVLITDGNETEGSVLAAAESARAMGVPIDVLPLAYRYEGEVIVEQVETPTSARMGDLIDVRITVTATRPTEGTLMILLSGTPIDLDPHSPAMGLPVRLSPGTNSFRVPLGINRRGPQEIVAVFEPSGSERGIGDTIEENNRAGSITFFSGEGRVLVLSGTPQESVALVGAFEAERIGVDALAADEAPRSLVDFNAYDAVVLCNVPVYAFSAAQQEAIKQYVEDSGGGLIVTGGPDAFGAGGWIGSPVEDVLPVQLDPPQTRQMPMGALAIVLDASGSMGQQVGHSGMSQQQLANQASIAAIETLSRLDLVAVIAFSGQHEVIVPLTSVSDHAGIAQRIRRIGPGGGTNMFPAIDAAFEQLARSPAGVRHIIVLSDGQTTGDPRAGVRRAAEIFAAGTTISTVVIGDMSDDNLMAHLAHAGGGRSYVVRGGQGQAELPRIFIKEAQTVKRSLIWEGDPFEPQFTGMPSVLMKGVAAVPSTRGYIVTADRQDGLASVTLRSPANDPILAHWQRGLGRVIAFTSDVSSRWSPGWVGWEGFQSFWAEHMRWAMRPSGSAVARTRIERFGDEAVLSIELSMPDSGERVNFAAINGRVAGPNGSSRAIEVRQDGPGRYSGRFPTPDPGSYIVGLRYRTPGSEDAPPLEGAVQAAVTRPMADEFRAIEDNSGLLRQIAERTGGRMLNPDPQRAGLWLRDGLEMPVARQPIAQLLTIVALGIFLVDVAVRRVRLDLAILRKLYARAFGRTASREIESVRTLRGVSERVRRESIDAHRPGRTSVPPTVFQPPLDTQLGDDGPLADEPGVPGPQATQGQHPGDDATPPEDGLGRLLRAKRRAIGDMEQEDSP